MESDTVLLYHEAQVPAWLLLSADSGSSRLLCSAPQCLCRLVLYVESMLSTPFYKAPTSVRWNWDRCRAGPHHASNSSSCCVWGVCYATLTWFWCKQHHLLSQIAMGLDQLEREMMAEGGLDSEDYLRFVAQDSGNVAVDGMFSIQVSKRW